MPSIEFDHFIIETPSGKKVRVNPINAYPVDWKIPNRQYKSWYGQFVDIAPEIDACDLFIEAKFNPTYFLMLLKSKGYKIYWE